MPVSPARAALPPPLKWAGGKRWQVPHLRPIWQLHKHRRLVEPFCGGLAVALGLQPGRALLNDANPHLVSFYRWLKRGLTIDIPLENREQAFYEHRDRFNALIASDARESREVAALFYYLNRTGYNGLCRFNRTGEFNVPFGQYARIRYERDFTRYVDALDGWQFSNDDFAKLPLESGDFVYADPPYDVPFRSYSRDGFPWGEQERVAEYFATHPGPVVLVNQATPRIDRLYRSLGYAVRYLKAPRRIACTGNRTPAREVFASRNV